MSKDREPVPLHDWGWNGSLPGPQLALVMRDAIDPAVFVSPEVLADPNPMPRFRLFRWSRRRAT